MNHATIAYRHAEPPPSIVPTAEGWVERRYFIRYRGTKPSGAVALIVEDERGTAYLFCEGALRLSRSGSRASDRLRLILARQSAWRALPLSPPIP